MGFHRKAGNTLDEEGLHFVSLPSWEHRLTEEGCNKGDVLTSEHVLKLSLGLSDLILSRKNV